MTIPEDMKSIVEQVKTYAQAHYEEDGWDFLIETYEDEEIIELINDLDISPTLSLDAVIKGIAEVMALHDERRAGILNERF